MRLGDVKDVSKITGENEQRIWTLVREGIFDNGIVVRFGRRYKFNLDRLEEFILNGGKSYPGGWRKDAA